MKAARKNCSSSLSDLFQPRDVPEAEALLYDQAVLVAELKGEGLVDTYNKLCYERLGELYEVPPEQRMSYIRDEVQDPSMIWGAGIYNSFRQREHDRRDFWVAQTMGLTVKECGVPCRKCKMLTVVMWFLYTRSADEATTTFFNCMSCNAKWREN